MHQPSCFDSLSATALLLHYSRCFNHVATLVSMLQAWSSTYLDDSALFLHDTVLQTCCFFFYILFLHLTRCFRLFDNWGLLLHLSRCPKHDASLTLVLQHYYFICFVLKSCYFACIGASCLSRCWRPVASFVLMFQPCISFTCFGDSSLLLHLLRCFSPVVSLISVFYPCCFTWLNASPLLLHLSSLVTSAPLLHLSPNGRDVCLCINWTDLCDLDLGLVVVISPCAL